MSTRWRQLLILSINQRASASFVVKKGLNFRTSIVHFSCCGRNCEYWFLCFKCPRILYLWGTLTVPFYETFGILHNSFVIAWHMHGMQSTPFTHNTSCFHTFSLVHDDQWHWYRYKIKLREQQELIRNQRKSQVFFSLEYSYEARKTATSLL